MHNRHSVNIKFWGVRGSIATPLSNEALMSKIETAIRSSIRAGLTDESRVPGFIQSLPWHVRQTAGGDTSCVEIRAGGKLIILDAGTGLRALGLDILENHPATPIEAHIFLTHTHWDHISGIPFFAPGFNPANRLTIYGIHPDLKKRLKWQQTHVYFPAPLNTSYQFVQLNVDTPIWIDDVRIDSLRLHHPGGCYSYRIEYENKVVVYATDSEYKDLSADALKPFTDFFANADVLIYDAQYTMLENVEKEDWGHSNVFSGVDMALEANVKRIVFTHHDPAYDDGKLWEILKTAREYLKVNQTSKHLEVYLASEGRSISI